MDDKEFALNVIWENYIDVIKINVVSGSYKFLKTPVSEARKLKEEKAL